MNTTKRSFVATLLLSLIALLAVGCGSSSDDFVVTNTNQNNATTGALTFQFVRVQTTAIADSTTDLLFEFRNANNEIVLTRTVAFASPATEVTITGIPADATQVEITALQNGFPVATITDTVTVVLGQTGVVDLSGATNTAITFDSLTATPNPTDLAGGESQTLAVVANFSDTSIVPVPNSAVTFASNNTDLVNVSADGIISTLPETGGNTTVNASWPLNGVTQEDNVVVRVTSFFFDQEFPTEMEQNSAFDLENRFINSAGDQQELEGADEVTYSFVPEVAGVTIEDGDDIAVGPNVAPGTTFQLQTSIVDTNSGLTQTSLSPVITVIAD